MLTSSPRSWSDDRVYAFYQVIHDVGCLCQRDVSRLDGSWWIDVSFSNTHSRS
jgi:hypothetical protein